jgi:hypothetical protein
MTLETACWNCHLLFQDFLQKKQEAAAAAAANGILSANSPSGYRNW